MCGRSGRGSNWRAASAISRCSIRPLTASLGLRPRSDQNRRRERRRKGPRSRDGNSEKDRRAGTVRDYRANAQRCRRVACRLECRPGPIPVRAVSRSSPTSRQACTRIVHRWVERAGLDSSTYGDAPLPDLPSVAPERGVSTLSGRSGRVVASSAIGHILPVLVVAAHDRLRRDLPVPSRAGERPLTTPRLPLMVEQPSAVINHAHAGRKFHAAPNRSGSDRLCIDRDRSRIPDAAGGEGIARELCRDRQSSYSIEISLPV
jgi:hypothetical protein